MVALSLAVGDPSLAVLGAFGALSSSLAATQLTAAGAGGGLQYKNADGLLSYNGCLVGCASSVFFADSLTTAAFVTFTGATAATLTTLTLSNSVFTQQPQWTFHPAERGVRIGGLAVREKYGFGGTHRRRGRHGA